MGWFRSKRPKTSPIIYVGKAQGSKRMPLRTRIQVMSTLWRIRREFTKDSYVHDRPSFYTPAKPVDVDGIAVKATDGSVGQFVPVDYEAYAWLPNPAWKWVEPHTEGALKTEEDDENGQWAKPVSWSDVAKASGKTMDKTTRWGDICGSTSSNGYRALSPNQAWTWGPHEGTIEPCVAEVLFEMLAQWTQPTDRCLSGQWEGAARDDWESSVKLVTSHWSYSVWACQFDPLREWLMLPDSFEREKHLPHVVWPADRSWFLATLYSDFCNYVAGSRTLIDAILESDIEAYEVLLTDHAY